MTHDYDKSPKSDSDENFEGLLPNEGKMTIEKLEPDQPQQKIKKEGSPPLVDTSTSLPSNIRPQHREKFAGRPSSLTAIGTQRKMAKPSVRTRLNRHIVIKSNIQSSPHKKLKTPSVIEVLIFIKY